MIAGVSICFAQTVGIRPGAKTVVWSPPPVYLGVSPRSTVPKEMVGTLQVAKTPIILEKTKLEDIRRQFGGTIGYRGDAAAAEAWLCLHGSETDGDWILWLTSGEMHGLTNIGGFYWRRIGSNEVPDRRCSSLTHEEGEVILPIPLTLGMTGEEVRQLLGQPSAVWGDRLLYDHEHQRVIRKEPWTVYNEVIVTIRKNAVWAIEVSKLTSD